MKWITGFFAFWYDFIVGDDWTVAVGVVAALVIIGLLVAVAGLTLWWLMPLAVVLLLWASLQRVARSSGT